MVLPAAGNSISFAQIRNEFFNANASGNPSAYGTSDANLYNLNFYRGKHHYVGPLYYGYYTTFTTGTIDFYTFFSKQANCNCACDCDCACDCGDCP